MQKTRVLVVDDDPTIRRLVSANLEKRNYAVREAVDGSTAIEEIKREVPDLVILDLKMPGLTGNEVCQWIRESWDIPIIVLSAHDDEELKVDALDSGADDYVTKPFKFEEFLARMRAVMRRAASSDQSDSSSKIRIGSLMIDLKGKRVFVDDRDIRLTRTEFTLLSILAQNLDSVLTHDQLLAKAWGVEYRGSSHYLHVYFGRIRKKMGQPYSAHLETVPGLGYILHTFLPQ
jgi:two-component system, OmpR family, KDP operon response regulator KdpE